MKCVSSSVVVVVVLWYGSSVVVVVVVLLGLCIYYGVPCGMCSSGVGMV